MTISPLNMDAAERAREFGPDYNNPHLSIGDKEFQFDPENGEWYEGKSRLSCADIFLIIIFEIFFFKDTESSTKSRRLNSSSAQNGKIDLNKLKTREKSLQEENNLLRIKNDLLLDMISEVYSEMKLETAETKRN